MAGVPGVTNDEIKMPLQNGVDRSPIDARALHADMRDLRCLQPVTQRLELTGHRAKRAHLFVRAGTWHAEQNARYYRLLMNV